MYNHKVSQKLRLGGDFQYRSQSNPQQDIYHPFANDLLRYGIRFTAWYQLSEQSPWTIIVSPFLHFRGWDMNDRGQLRKFTEYRFTAGISHRKKINRVQINNRFLHEVRRINRINAPIAWQHRPRWQLQALIPLVSLSKDKEWQLNHIIFDEFFVAYQNEMFSFDQNRLYNAIQIKYSKYFELNIGFQGTIQKGKTNYTWRNQFHLSTNIYTY